MQLVVFVEVPNAVTVNILKHNEWSLSAPLITLIDHEMEKPTARKE